MHEHQDIPEGAEHGMQQNSEKPAPEVVPAPTGETASVAETIVPHLDEHHHHSPLRHNLLPQETYGIIGGFGLFGLLLYSVFSTDSPVNPFFPLAALLFFLYPFRRGIIIRRISQLAIGSFLLWLFFSLSGVFLPFILAFVFAYFCAPLVTVLASRGIPRWLTSLTVVLIIVGVYTLIGIFVIPNVVNQFDGMMASIQGLLVNANSVLDTDRIVKWLTQYGMPRDQAERIVAENIEPQIRAAATWLFAWMGQFVQNVTSILEGLANLILVPILSFYITVDFHRVRTFVRSKVLQDNPKYVYYAKKIDTILSAYIHGILLTSSMVGTMAVAVLSIFQVPFAIIIGVLTGVFNLIPTLGMFINLGVAIIIYLFLPDGFWYNTIVTAAMIFGLHALNGYFVEPRVLGTRVGLHPVIIIASLFAFGYFFGFVGLLIAVPATAVLLMFVKEWYSRTGWLSKPAGPVNY